MGGVRSLGMSQHGGSATIYGVLYQILGPRAWTATIRLRASVDGAEVSWATLVVEPTGGEGDLQVNAAKARIAQQTDLLRKLLGIDLIRLTDCFGAE